MKRRIYALDTIRGILILGVVLYHFLYDLSVFYNVSIPLLNVGWVRLLRDAGAGIFIFIAGISCNLSSNNLRRGIIALIWGMVISVITYVFMPGQVIVFGILHLIGTSILLYCLLPKKTETVEPRFGILFCMLCYLLFLPIRKIRIEAGWYAARLVLFIAGFDTGLYSADYYPVIPWIFIFIGGTLMKKYVTNEYVCDKYYENRFPVINAIGRNTLFIYILHQPLLYLLLLLVEGV